MDDPLAALQSRLKHSFKDPRLLRRALTHSSIALTRLDSNERMEFLGDAVLGFVVCEMLFHRYPEYPEGELTRIKSSLVSRSTCAKICRQLKLDHCLYLGKGLTTGGAKIPQSVVSASLEHSCGADYVAVLRPRLTPLARARAVERALWYWGRPYDFNFDFATDDEVVCSELVLKAFEPTDGGGKGLEIPFVEVAGRRAVPPTEFVRVFANELGRPDARFEFVAFLEGREKERRAVVADEKALAATVARPKWDIVQP